MEAMGRESWVFAFIKTTSTKFGQTPRAESPVLAVGIFAAVAVVAIAAVATACISVRATVAVAAASLLFFVL